MKGKNQNMRETYKKNYIFGFGVQDDYDDYESLDNIEKSSYMLCSKLCEYFSLNNCLARLTDILKICGGNIYI